MFPYLQSLSSLLRPGVQLQRNEVIKRYRSLKNHSREVLQFICMTEFHMLSKTEKGELRFS